MKTIYRINVSLMIINVFLGFMILLEVCVLFYFNNIYYNVIIYSVIGLTSLLSLLFIAIIATYQVVIFISYLTKWDKISNKLKIPIVMYGALTTIVLMATFNINQPGYIGNNHFIIILILSFFLAFYFLYLSKKQKDYYQLKIGE